MAKCCDTNPTVPSMPYNCFNCYTDSNGLIPTLSGYVANNNTTNVTIYSQGNVQPNPSGNIAVLNYYGQFYIYGTTTTIGSYQSYSGGAVGYNYISVTPSYIISMGGTNANIGTPIYYLLYSELTYVWGPLGALNLPASFNPSSPNPGGLQRGFSITVQPCNEPLGLYPTTTFASGQVLLNWFTPSDNAGSAFTDYLIQYRTTSGPGAWNTFAHAPSILTSITITGLTNGISYDFQVAAINGYCVTGGGPASGPFSDIATSTPITIPDAPTDLVATPGATNMSLTWNIPNDGGFPLTSYTLQYRTTIGPGAWNTITGISTGPPTPPHYTVTGLALTTSYDFQVAAVNLIGTSAYSSPIVTSSTGTVPDAPTNLVGTHGNTLVDLSWNAPLNDGGYAISSYFVEYKLDSVIIPPGSWSSINTGSSSTTYTVTSLTNGSLYDFRVSAVNSIGTGAHSNVIEETPSTVPNAPVLTVSSCQNLSVPLTWTDPSNGGAPITSFTLRYRVSAGPGAWTTITGVTGTSYTVSPLINTVQYDFQVAAVNFNGIGAYSTPISTATPSIFPNAPTNLTGVVSSGQVILSWTAPTSTGGNPITEYIIVQITGNVGGPQTIIYTGSTSTTYTVTGLTNGTTYFFSVAGINCSGTGLFSLYYSTIPISYPDAPTNLVAIGCQDGQVTLTWTVPNNGGSAILDYIVRSRTTGPPPGGWVVYNHFPSTNNTIVVTGLTNGISFDFQVAAQNAAGIGPYSSIVSAIPIASPTPPGNLQAITLPNGNINLTWTASTQDPSGGQTVSYYIIYYKMVCYGTWARYVPDVSGGVTSYELTTNIANNVQYFFKMVAVNSCGGISDYSNIATGLSNNNSVSPRAWPRAQTTCPNCVENFGYQICGSAPSTSTFQLDMRRKAEILQYKQNSGLPNFMRWSLAARNQLTRQKSWASQNQVVSLPNVENLPREGNILLCPSTPIPCNPTTDSDVPGKQMNLCYNPTIPLYNYRVQRTFAGGVSKWPTYGPPPKLNY